MIKQIKKLLVKNDYNILNIDLHSHLIPGIDDGSKSMQESIELIVEFQKLGYTRLITTPHIMSHRYKNNSKIILDGLEILKKELSKQKIDIQIEAAAEYYVDNHFIELLNNNDLLSFGDNYILFELSYSQQPLHLEQIIFDIQEAGYRPVLAHPERYLYFCKDFSKYERLKELGLFFQLNINSLSTYYSKVVQKTAYKLIDKGMINFLGSDVHHKKHMQNLINVRKTSHYKNLFSNNSILNNSL